MTIEEINALTVETLEVELIGRIYRKEDPRPEEIPNYTIEQLEAELLIYKDELIVIENERLRVQDLKDRFKVIEDIDAGFPAAGALYLGGNAAVYFRDRILKESNHTLAESRLSTFEDKAIEIETARLASEVIKESKRADKEALRKAFKAKPSSNITLSEIAEIVKGLL